MVADSALPYGRAMQIAGRVAIVTGASSGIGAAIAVELARREASVVAVARREPELRATVDECNRHGVAGSSAYPADLSVLERCTQVVEHAVAEHGRVDILVNNAGISVHKNAARTSVDDVHRLMALNFFAPVHLATAALPGMLERQAGSIVNVTSVAGYVPNGGEAAYGASKAALSRWTHGLAVDLHGTGVHAGVVSPGPIATEIWSLDEELTYTGKLFPPARVALAVVKVIEREAVHVTVPRRYGAVGALYPLFGRAMRAGLHRYESRARARS
jgi:short-subunit dehydrogenase